MVSGYYPTSIDATRIAPGLYQGSKPPIGHQVLREGFDMLILTAVEYQPPALSFPGVRVIHAPNDDSGAPMTRSEWRIAVAAGKLVALALRDSRTVLVTCAQGRNRSGLVSALALHRLTGRSGAECVRIVQSKRKDALTNKSFVEALKKLKDRR